MPCAMSTLFVIKRLCWCRLYQFSALLNPICNPDIMGNTMAWLPLLFAPEADVPNLVDILEAIDATRVSAMQDSLAAVRSRFVFQVPLLDHKGESPTSHDPLEPHKGITIHDLTLGFPGRNDQSPGTICIVCKGKCCPSCRVILKFEMRVPKVLQMHMLVASEHLARWFFQTLPC